MNVIHKSTVTNMTTVIIVEVLSDKLNVHRMCTKVISSSQKQNLEEEEEEEEEEAVTYLQLESMRNPD